MSVAITARSKGRKKSYMAKAGEVDRKWLLVDATDAPLGRLATRLAIVLQGKHRPTYTPHIDTGDFVVVTNVRDIKITGKKRGDKLLGKYTGYSGGRKELSVDQLMAKNPAVILELAVRRMLPKGRLGRSMIKKMKAYRGPTHPHEAQNPEPVELLKKK